MAAIVGVVVVNYNGGELTLDCLRSLLRTDWPPEDLRIVLVDNASSDGIAARVRNDMAAVEVIESSVNGGFGAGCNLGIGVLVDSEYVVLLNNDATVTSGWLQPLVDTLVDDPGLGAACPKILFMGSFQEVELRSDTIRRGRGDTRELGVVVGGARIGDDDVWRRVQLVDGFWGVEADAAEAGSQWSAEVAHLRVPLPDEAAGPCTFLLSADRPVRVEMRSGDHRVEHLVDEVPRWFAVPLGGPAVDVINNTGTLLTMDGFGADRGYQEPDDGRYDTPTDVFAWCGGAVLLRRAYLDDVGPFAEELFLYYEDLELSWRGAKHGWRYRYVPTSVVRHVHAATSVDGSALKRYYDERNHLLVLARHAPAARAARAVGRSLLVTASYARRDVVAAALTGRPPHARVIKDRLAAFRGFVRLLPRTLSSRRSSRR